MNQLRPSLGEFPPFPEAKHADTVRVTLKDGVFVSPALVGDLTPTFPIVIDDESLGLDDPRFSDRRVSRDQKRDLVARNLDDLLVGYGLSVEASPPQRTEHRLGWTSGLGAFADVIRMGSIKAVTLIDASTITIQGGRMTDVIAEKTMRDLYGLHSSAIEVVAPTQAAVIEIDDARRQAMKERGPLFVQGSYASSHYQHESQPAQPSLDDAGETKRHRGRLLSKLGRVGLILLSRVGR